MKNGDYYRSDIKRTIWAVNALEEIYADQPEIVTVYAKRLFNLSNAYPAIEDKQGCIDKGNRKAMSEKPLSEKSAHGNFGHVNIRTPPVTEIKPVE